MKRVEAGYEVLDWDRQAPNAAAASATDKFNSCKEVRDECAGSAFACVLGASSDRQRLRCPPPRCSVGAADKNIWLFSLASGKPVLQDSENLILDRGRAQVFNFDAVLVGTSTHGIEFFSSTEEGVLWEGTIGSGKIAVTDITKIVPDGGAALRATPDGKLLAVVAYDLLLFDPQPIGPKAPRSL